MIIVSKRLDIILFNFKRCLSLLLLTSFSFSLFSLPTYSKVFFLEADYYQDKTKQRKLILGKGEIISSNRDIERVAVSDPSISDLQVLNEKQIFVRAKQLGISTFLVWERDNPSPTRFDITVWPDIEYLTKQLQDLDKSITVEYIPLSNNSINNSSVNLQSGTPPEQASSADGGGGGAGPVPTLPSLPMPSASQQQQSGGSSSNGSSSASNSLPGKIILKGTVTNAESIARALQIAGAYVGDQGIKIISQPGGQIVDGLGGKYDISSNTDAAQQTGGSGQGSALSFGARDPMRFTSNRYANLSRGVIATTQKGAVVSFLTVKDQAQISVAIRFYEVSRSVARELGINTTFGGADLQGGSFVGGGTISQASGIVSSLVHGSSAMAGNPADITLGHGSASTVTGGSFLSQTLGQGVTGVLFNPNNGIGLVLQALQEKGEIKTLAEPNLVITNGEPASFLAGGEVPILRSVFTAGGASTDVTYEPFGIKFNMLPTLTGQNKIYLQLVPEIRDIDNDLSNFVAPTGASTVRPPAFKTRRTQTQVELESGQAFAISGLLREDNTRTLRKVPGAGDIPILGTLFRSKSFKKGESELLIVVTPKIIKPTTIDKIAEIDLPTKLPYHYYDELAPLRPYIELFDEEGPQLKPLDPAKYNEPKIIVKENTEETGSVEE